MLTAFWLPNMRAEAGVKFHFRSCATETQQLNTWNTIKEPWNSTYASASTESQGWSQVNHTIKATSHTASTSHPMASIRSNFKPKQKFSASIHTNSDILLMRSQCGIKYANLLVISSSMLCICFSLSDFVEDLGRFRQGLYKTHELDMHSQWRRDGHLRKTTRIWLLK